MPQFSKSDFEKLRNLLPGQVNIMRNFTMKEISSVTSPAQKPAKAVLIKVDDTEDDEDDGDKKLVEKLVLLTSEEDGHQHAVELRSYVIEQGGGNTSYANGSGEYGHSHPFVINPDGSITIGSDRDHTHKIEASEIIAQLRVKQMLSSLTRSDDGPYVSYDKKLVKNGLSMTEFALASDPLDPETWAYPLAKKSGSLPDRRLVGNAVDALRKNKVSSDDRASFIRRTRAAWIKSHVGHPLSSMPSVLKTTDFQSTL